MSIVRHDPNASKVIPPEVYHRNAAQLQRIKGLVENFEMANESGRRNFEDLEKMEYELRKKVEEGAQALEQLKRLQSQKSMIEKSSPPLMAEDPAYTSRVDEVGAVNQAAPRSIRPPDQQPGLQQNAPSAAQNFQQSYPTQFVHYQPNHPNPHSQSVPPPTPYQYMPYGYVAYHPLSQLPRQGMIVPHPNVPSSVSGPQRQAPQHIHRPQQYLPSNQEPINAPPQGPRGTHITNTSQATTFSNSKYYRARPTGAVAMPNVQSVPHTSTLQQTRPPSSAQPPVGQVIPANAPQPRPMYNDPLVASSSSSRPSLLSAPGTSMNPSNAQPSSNIPQPISSEISSTPDSSFSSNSSLTKVAMPPVPESLSTPGNIRMPIFHLPHNPTEQQLLAARNQLIKWGNDTAAPGPDYANSFFNFFGWRVNCFKDQDGAIQVRLQTPHKVVVMNLGLFVDQVVKHMTTLNQHGMVPPLPPPPPVALPGEPGAGDSQKTPRPPNSPPSGNIADQVSVGPSPVAAQVPNSVPVPTTPLKRPSLVTINGNGSLPSPREANRKTLARDIMFGLGKRLRPTSSSAENSDQPAKRHATEAEVKGQSGTNTLQLGQPIVQPISSPQVTVPEASSSVSATCIPHLPNGTGSTTKSNPPATSDKPTPQLVQGSAPPSQAAPQEMPARQGNEASTTAKPESEPKPKGSSLPVLAMQSMPSVVTSATPNTGHVQMNLLSALSKLPTSPEWKGVTSLKACSWESKPISSGPSQASKKEAVLGSIAPSRQQEVGPVTIATTPIVSRTQVPVVRSNVPAKDPSPSRSKPTVIDLTSPTRSVPVVFPGASSSRNNEPLFLPSSSPEPSLVAGPSRLSDESSRGSLISGVTESNEGPATKKRKMIPYVLVPPAPEYLVRHRQQMKREQKEASGSGSGAVLQRLNIGSRTSSVPTSIVGEEDFAYPFEIQRNSPQDENEREAIRLACSRLQKLSCRWDGCDCKLNSVDALIRHLNQHKPEPSQHKKSFMCRWTQCGQQGINFKEKHLEKHASLPLRCAYLDCNDTFRSGAQLFKHFRTKHRDGPLKPSAKPCVPTLNPLEPVPGIVPSYSLVTKLVGRESIIKDRHEHLAKKVARNITSSDQLPKRPKKTARSSNQNALLAAQTSDDYEFLTTRSTRYSSYISQPVDIELSDLESANISIMIDKGLTLWGSDGGDFEEDDEEDASPPGSPLFTPTRRVATHGEIKLEADDEPSNDSSGRHHDEHSSDEEDAAVEIMLTDMSMTS